MEHHNALQLLASMAVPIIAIVMGIGMAMVKAYLGYLRRSEALRLYHAERLAAIEKGIELPPPPTVLNEIERRGEPGWVHHRRIGLILLLLGLAVSGALWGSHADGYQWGLVPAAIGLGYLVASLLEAREQRQLQQGNPPPRG